MDIYEQMSRDANALFGYRVAESVVANILRLIATVPNKRQKPITGDPPGDFDFWFDGGAAKIFTGYTNYYFPDGTRARVETIPLLSVQIEFVDGRKVDVRQERWADNEAG